jgi:hypothetical protein
MFGRVDPFRRLLPSVSSREIRSTLLAHSSPVFLLRTSVCLCGILCSIHALHRQRSEIILFTIHGRKMRIPVLIILVYSVSWLCGYIATHSLSWLR